MSDEIEAITESAKAAQEVAKTTGKALDLVQAGGAYLAQMLGTVPQDVVGLLGGDLIRQYRIRNWYRISQETFDKLVDLYLRGLLDIESLITRSYTLDEINEAVVEYAERIAENDPFKLRMIKSDVNQVQDTQGCAAQISAAHLMHIVSSEGEKDPDYALKVPKGARRPMVERAFENYERRRR